MEEKRYQRKILREYLKKLGCGILQDSVWLTPYNPKLTLKTFIDENFPSGSIIVSDIGENGSIGDEDLGDLVSRVYHLDRINQKYEQFIYEHKNKNTFDVSSKFWFLSILREDPQLPFEILPYNWLGDKAYQLIKNNYPS